MKIFTYENVFEAVKELKENLDFPYVYIQVSTLGGKENVSILIRLSEQVKENWYFGIFHNSPYRHIHIDSNGVVDNFSIGSNLKKIRKFTSKSIKQIAEKINKSKAVKLLEI